MSLLCRCGVVVVSHADLWCFRRGLLWRTLGQVPQAAQHGSEDQREATNRHAARGRHQDEGTADTITAALLGCEWESGSLTDDDDDDDDDVGASCSQMSGGHLNNNNNDDRHFYGS